MPDPEISPEEFEALRGLLGEDVRQPPDEVAAALEARALLRREGELWAPTIAGHMCYLRARAASF